MVDDDETLEFENSKESEEEFFKIEEEEYASQDGKENNLH